MASLRHDTNAVRMAAQVYKLLQINGYTDVCKMLSTINRVTGGAIQGHEVAVPHGEVELFLFNAVELRTRFKTTSNTAEFKLALDILAKESKLYTIGYYLPVPWDMLAQDLCTGVCRCLGGNPESTLTLIRYFNHIGVVKPRYYAVGMKNLSPTKELPRIYHAPTAYSAMASYARDFLDPDYVKVLSKMDIKKSSVKQFDLSVFG